MDEEDEDVVMVGAEAEEGGVVGEGGVVRAATSVRQMSMRVCLEGEMLVFARDAMVDSESEEREDVGLLRVDCGLYG